MSNELKLEHLWQELEDVERRISDCNDMLGITIPTNYSNLRAASFHLTRTTLTVPDRLALEHEVESLRNRKREIETAQAAIYEQMDNPESCEKAPQGEINEKEQAKTPPQEDDGMGSGRRAEQIRAIVRHAKELKYDPLHIPYGGKGMIEELCLNDPLLFTESGFGHAWKAAKRGKLIDIEGAETYKARP